MSAGAIGGVAATTDVQVNRFADLKSQDFIKVMLAELSQQDPFEPADSAALLEQLASLRNVESQLDLQNKLESLVLQNQVAVAGGMIGLQVSGIGSASGEVSGIVTSVRVQDGEALLELDTGQTLAMDRVTRIDRPTSVLP